MEKTDDIYEVLDSLGLTDKEILSISKRNKLVFSNTKDEVNNIIDFFKIKCNFSKDEIATLIINNPFILNEEPVRINILASIYDEIGFSEKEYKEYVKNYDRAFSLNPKVVSSNDIPISFQMVPSPKYLINNSNIALGLLTRNSSIIFIEVANSQKPKNKITNNI